jgi:hypothetical protein
MLKSRDFTKKKLKIPKGNPNPYIKEQTTQWPKEKVQTTIYKAYTSKDRVKLLAIVLSVL